MALTEDVIEGNTICCGIIQIEEDDLPGLSVDPSQWESAHTTAGFKHARERQGKEGSEMPNKHGGPGSICIIKRNMVKPLKIFYPGKTGIHDTDGA